MDKKCEFVNDGKKCQAYKIKASQFCFIHSPDKAEERKQALNKASEVKELYLPNEEGTALAFNLPQKINLVKSKDIRKAYTSIIKGAFAGLDKSVVGCLIYALNGYCAQLDKLELLERIERLEKQLGKMGIKIK